MHHEGTVCISNKVALVGTKGLFIVHRFETSVITIAELNCILKLFYPNVVQLVACRGADDIFSMQGGDDIVSMFDVMLFLITYLFFVCHHYFHYAKLNDCVGIGLDFDRKILDAPHLFLRLSL